jgi:hypothetical protein
MSEDLTEQEVEKMLEDDPKSPGQPPPPKVNTGTNTKARESVSVGTDTETIRCRSSSISLSTTSASATNAGMPKAYFNVRAARASDITVRPLTGSQVTKHDLDNFVTESDNRYLAANHRHCFSTK